MSFVYLLWALMLVRLGTSGCGSGKTFIGSALGHSACLRGYSVRYYRLSRLFLELTQAKADGSYHKRLKLLAKIQLIIIERHLRCSDYSSEAG